MLHYESNFSRIQVYLRIPIDTGIYSCIFHEFPFMTCDFNNKSTAERLCINNVYLRK